MIAEGFTTYSSGNILLKALGSDWEQYCKTNSLPDRNLADFLGVTLLNLLVMSPKGRPDQENSFGKVRHQESW